MEIQVNHYKSVKDEMQRDMSLLVQTEASNPISPRVELNIITPPPISRELNLFNPDFPELDSFNSDFTSILARKGTTDPDTNASCLPQIEPSQNEAFPGFLRMQNLAIPNDSPVMIPKSPFLPNLLELQNVLDSPQMETYSPAGSNTPSMLDWSMSMLSEIDDDPVSTNMITEVCSYFFGNVTSLVFKN